MQYNGRHTIFDPSNIDTYPLATRKNKVHFDDLKFPPSSPSIETGLPVDTVSAIASLADELIALRNRGCPVILFTGAHLIKNGLGPLLVDLIKKGAFSLVAGNGATAIHDFELALIGQTSEDVPGGLNKGLFGMSYEFCLLNAALSIGDQALLGYGESLGLMICDPDFRAQAIDHANYSGPLTSFTHPDVSVIAACHQCNIPFTVHVGIGTDVIDQHPSFDGRAKGGCSGRDFLIYAEQLTRFDQGGMAINIGSAVQGPEVLLKSVSLAANSGHPPNALITADFDLNDHNPSAMTNESSPQYYRRDHKSVVTRIPEAFSGRGLYIQGNHKETFPAFYHEITKRKLNNE